MKVTMFSICLVSLILTIKVKADVPLEHTPCWTASPGSCSHGIAFGDMDNDGYPDLAVANDEYAPNPQPNYVYKNINGQLETEPSWISTEKVHVYVAWGDVDKDCDLDWSGAWGDMNGDGRVDLAVGNINWALYNRVYINQDTILETVASWTAGAPGYLTIGMAWADVNNDGWFDLACGNGASAGDVSMANILFLNHEGILETSPSWISNDLRSTCAVAFAMESQMLFI
ncbi:MAG: VCBS repeat-containing protein [bacterium]|nr:VCBS repeat-containing protein [bacterium]